MRSSQAAFDLIVAEEVSSKAAYEAKYRRPILPGVASGITIGIGYDLGYVREDEVRRDWGGVLPDDEIDKLVECCGLRGAGARPALSAVQSVDVPYEAAIEVYRKRTIPKYERMVAALPNAEKLSPDSFGALTSLVLNRGASFDRDGDRFREMRAIKQHMEAEDFAAIPAEFRSMKRVWEGDPKAKGLLGRRDREAALFQKGLRQAPVPRPLPRPAPPPDIEPPPPAQPKPAVKSKINWAAIGAFLASIGGLLTDWRVLAVIVTGILLAFIIWNRSGKPDIGGWFRS